MREATSRIIRIGAAVWLLLPCCATSFADGVLPVLGIVQEDTNWCWAACSSMILDYYGMSVNQCTIANWVYRDGLDDCCGITTCALFHCCNQTNGFCGGTRWGVQGVLANWGVTSDCYGSYPYAGLSENAVRSEIDAGRPFVIGWSWALGGGHALVGIGITGDNVHYWDPLPPERGGGYKISSYSLVALDTDHTWTDTLVITTIPPAATLMSPSGTITTTVPTYSWNAVSGATGYRLYVQGPSGMVIDAWYDAGYYSGTGDLCESGGGLCSTWPQTYLADGAHTWKIQARNSAGDGPWSTEMSFTVAVPPSLPVRLVAPLGIINDMTPTYTWEPVYRAEWYYLLVNDSSGSPVIQQWYSAEDVGCASGVGTCAVTPTTTLATGNYTWKIQTRNNGGYGPWSIEGSFKVSSLYAALLLSPSGTICTTTPTYIWKAVSGATTYYLWVNGPAGTPVIMDLYSAENAGCESGSGTCAVTPTTALETGIYTWKIWAWNNVEYGPWSTDLTFTVTVPICTPTPIFTVTPIPTPTPTRTPIIIPTITPTPTVQPSNSYLLWTK